MHEMNKGMEEKKDKPKLYPVSASEYKLLEEIGQGVSGLVYRAYCIPFNEYVAIKQMDLEKCNCPLDNVRKEAQTMSLINHPNVVKAHCSFVVSQNLWIVMPYMGGGSCLHIMKATSPDGFDEPVIATILRETLKALEYLHRQGHIHRDVKAGNILIDESGGVKLGDFGVSAFMFDNGDRQWARQTFIGTPCWMAPEVLEQLNGYDFKADIWSFGITALELAHGHAPFSKFPPMKVLLMTLQSAAPGLTYDRDRRFSKSFKEMIAMCLVKDPTKRPTAEKLLKHSFFKSAKSGDYIVRHVLEGLPPLWDRVKDVKLKDAARLAEKKMPFGEQEERSQNEYKRGVSGWNFDVDDLKAQAALIQDDFAPVKKEEEGGCKGSETTSRVASPFLSPHPEESHPSLETLKAEISVDGEECIVRTAIPCGKPPNGAKIKGRFNVFLDNPEVDASNWQEHPEHEECLHEERETEDSKLGTIKEILEDQRHPEPEHVVSIKTSDDEKDKDHKQEQSRVIEHKPANGAVKNSPGGKEDEKLKPPVVQKKGRFSVTSADVELKDLNKELKDLNKENLNKELERHPSVKVKNSIEHELERLPSLKVKGSINPVEHAEVLSPSAGLRRTSSAQVFSQPSGNVPATVVQLLQSLSNQVAQQQELISYILALVSNGEIGGISNQKLNRSASANAVDHGTETEREREYRQQVCELQARYAASLEEMQSMKQRNIQLERQLNAIFNKEEEERIRQEEQAKEDG